MVIEIQNAEYLSDYKIKLTFSDNKGKTVDFEPFLRKAKNPMTKKYLDINRFKDFKLNINFIFTYWDYIRYYILEKVEHKNITITIHKFFTAE